MAYVPKKQSLGSLFGDIFASAVSVVSSSIDSAAAAADTALIGTAEKEAAAQAAKLATEALQKKATTPVPVTPGAVTPAVIPVGQTPITVPAPQPVSSGMSPYLIPAIGAVVIGGALWMRRK